jgi:nucleoside-diphosphate-sugar epimerase
VEHPLETNDHNVTGTLHVLLAAKNKQVKRVVFSTSSSIYGGNTGGVAMTEDMKPHPESPYALQKLAGQEYCRLFSELYGLETVALCYFNVYGPFMDPEGAYALVIGKFLRQKQRGEPLTICGDGEYFRDYTHVTDIARANVLAMQAKGVGKGECLNIGNNDPVSVNTLADLIGGEKVYVPERKGDVRATKADYTKAKQLLGWEPSIDLKTGIEEMKKLWKIL